MQQDFGIGYACEVVAARDQLLAKFDVVEDLAVERDPERAVRVRHRLRFGAMRITGDGVWGPPRDRAEALATLRRAGELEINLIDTAESYGPKVSEELIAEALYPYPKGLVIATKGGYDRSGPHEWE